MIEMFDSLDPATGEVIGTFPAYDGAAVRDAVAEARHAALWWAGLGFIGREQRLTVWKSAIIRRVDELAELMHREGGKPVADATLEVILAVEHIGWAARHAQKVLGRRRVRPGLLMPNQAATVEYQPYGVVGVIGPWNYPVYTPMGSVAYALAAGNAVRSSPARSPRRWADGWSSGSPRRCPSNPCSH